MNKLFKVVVVTWLLLLTFAWLFVAIEWKPICHKVVVTERPDIYSGGKGWTVFCCKVVVEALEDNKVQKVSYGTEF